MSTAVGNAMRSSEHVAMAALEQPALRVQRAVSPEALLSCRHFVYRSYLAKGYLQQDVVKAKAAGTYHADQTHASPAARARGQVYFVESAPGELAATGTLIRDTPLHGSRFVRNGGLPLDKSLPRELFALRTRLGPGAVLAELGGLASSTSSVGGSQMQVLRAMRRGEAHTQPLTALFDELQRQAEAQGVTDLVVGVHPTHANFYERLGFTTQPLLSHRPGAEGLQNAEVVLLHGKTRELSTDLSAPVPRRTDDFFERAS